MDYEKMARIQQYKKVANRTINWFIVAMIATAGRYYFKNTIAEFLAVASFIALTGCFAKMFFLHYLIFKKRGNRYVGKQKRQD